MSRNNSMVRRQIYLTPQQCKLLSAISKKSGLTISDIIRRAIDVQLVKAAKQGG